MNTDNSVRPAVIARELCRQAKLTHAVQRATIHSVVMTARPGNRPRQVVNTWRAHYAHYNWEYRYSPVFADQRRQDDLAAKQHLQARADEALTRLQQAGIQDDYQIAGSLMVLCASPELRFVTVSWPIVYQALYNLGFRKSDRLGELASMNSRSQLRWMAGLTMSAIAHGADTLTGMRHLLALNQWAQEWLQGTAQTAPSCAA
jgi:hypothetical protein